MRYLQFAASVAVFLITAAAAAQFDSRNAATHYQRAFERMPALSEHEWMLMMTYDPNAGPPTGELRAALARVQPAFMHFREASLRTYADFHSDRSDGFFMTLSHLGHMRTLLRYSRVDVLVRLYDGDTAGAADRLAMAYRSLPHFSEDGTFISAPVTQSVFALTDQLTQEVIDRGGLNAADAAKVLHAVETFGSQPDPFNYIESIMGDRELLHITAERLLGADEDAVRKHVYLDEEDPAAGDALVERWMNLDEAELQANLATYDACVGGVVEAYAMDDSEAAAAQITRLMEEYRESEHNLMLTSGYVLAFDRYHEIKLEGEARLAARLESLRELVTGEVEPMELANAAVWYLRGVVMLGELEQEELEALRLVETDWSAQLPDVLTELLAEQDAIVEIFREGSYIRRCDFTITRHGRPHPFMPPYLPGMRDAFRLLNADAIRLMQADLPAEAAERLSVAYRVLGHLGGDDQIATAPVAHIAFLHLHNLVQLGHEKQLLDDEQMIALAAAFDRIALADPFGYGGAIRDARSRLIERFHHHRPRPRDYQDQIEPWNEVVREADGDALLGLLLLCEMLDTSDRPREPDEKTLAALEDIMPSAGHEALYERVVKIVEPVREGDIEAARAAQFEAIADISRRRADARTDLRRGIAMFHDVRRDYDTRSQNTARAAEDDS